jgi:IS5 family transposase
VSLHDPDARPIAKGRLGRPVEFGYKAQVVDNRDGIVLDTACTRPAAHCWPRRSPGSPRCSGARRGRSPPTVAGEAKVEQDLPGLGVATVVIPREASRRRPAVTTSTGAASAGW